MFHTFSFAQKKWHILRWFLPCVLAFMATTLNGLSQSQLQWQVRLLESQRVTHRIEGLGLQTTPLFTAPRVKTYSDDGYFCPNWGDTIYVQNQLMQTKLILENLIGFIGSWVPTLAVFQALVYVVYLLKQKLSWGMTIAILLLFAIVVILLVTIMGPSNGRAHPICISQLKIEAELMSISMDGIIYAAVGVILNGFAIVMMIQNYRWSLPEILRAE